MAVGKTSRGSRRFPLAFLVVAIGISAVIAIAGFAYLQFSREAELPAEPLIEAPAEISQTTPPATRTPIPANIQADHRILVESYLGRILKSEFLPPGYMTFYEPGIAIGNGSNSGYSDQWRTGGRYIHFSFIPDKQVEFVRLDIELPEVNSLDEKSTKELMGKYFNVVRDTECRDPPIFNGKQISGHIICESFWVDEKGDKNGVYALKSPVLTTLSSCLFPLGSKFYSKNTCLKATDV